MVFEQDGETNFGIHRIDLSSFDGETPIPAGQYSVRVDARDADNKAIQTNSFVRARVDEVETSGLTPLLTIGGQRIPLHQIAAVAA
ncbi:hypothetical protein JCM17844_18220 [Iodidimonas gelatinilytica]|uniref:Uncharacterized protein n=1 Tax=Iodidimonas gelatinilytica TaxID=1236966 RepID=A0A5A7MT87_9PROT|nr:hypothetical protein JCM17844_18220 [Iodidimonas gelatinilytica]